MAVAAAGGLIVLARVLEFEEPTAVDLRLRRLATAPRVRPLAKVLWPLFPLGLPGGYITLAYLIERQVARRTGRRAPEIPRAAWSGWIAHRGFKLFYRRVRPRRTGGPRRTDSYPSGHTTGATALALATSRVLRQRGLVSTRGAIATAIVPSVVMGAYRVLADDHWSTDVVGGWLLGAAIGLAVFDSDLRGRLVLHGERRMDDGWGGEPEGEP